MPTPRPPYPWAQTPPYLRLEDVEAKTDRRTQDLDFLVLLFIVITGMLVLMLVMVCIVWAVMAFCASGATE